MKSLTAFARIVIAVGLGLSAMPAGAAVIENWETPALASGTSSTTLPAGWNVFTNNGSEDVVNSPTSLLAPAGGRQYLQLSGINTGVETITSVAILANTAYTLSSAIGNFNASYGNSWSIQLWANTTGTGVTGGTFIGQQFATNIGANDPAFGTWVSDSFTFNSTFTPSLVGEDLVVLLNNYQAGSSFYDNVSITTSAAPEPATWAMMLIGLGGIGAAMRGSRCRQSRAVATA